jgi:hypothetical protein
MKSLPSCALLSALFLVVASSSASATSITFNYDCDITGAGCSSPTVPPIVGTLTITDSSADTNWVVLRVQLTDPLADIHTFLFNYTGFDLPSGYDFIAENTDTDVKTDKDNQKADGYNAAQFDLSIPYNGVVSGNPFVTTLKLYNGTTYMHSNSRL